MKRPNFRHRQRGIAALTAILIVTLATLVAVNILWRTSVDLRRTESLLLQEQIRQYNLGAEGYARVLLAEAARDDGSNGIDTRAELELANQQARFPVEGGLIEAWIDDAQGRFNLNDLVKDDGSRDDMAMEIFQRLLVLLPLETPVDPATATVLSAALADWIDPDEMPGPDGAEDDRYTGRQPPYRPANFWLVSISELRAVEGYTAQLVDALTPHVAALPRRAGGGPHAINVNTASAPVLAALAPGMTLDDGEALVGGEWQSVDEFAEDLPAVADDPALRARLAVSSSWFLLTASTSLGDTRSTMYSLLERNGDSVQTRLRTVGAQ